MSQDISLARQSVRKFPGEGDVPNRHLPMIPEPSPTAHTVIPATRSAAEGTPVATTKRRWGTTHALSRRSREAHAAEDASRCGGFQRSLAAPRLLPVTARL